MGALLEEAGEYSSGLSIDSASTAAAKAFNIPVRSSRKGWAGLKAEYSEPDSRRNDGGLAGG